MAQCWSVSLSQVTDNIREGEERVAAAFRSRRLHREGNLLGAELLQDARRFPREDANGVAIAIDVEHQELLAIRADHALLDFVLFDGLEETGPSLAPQLYSTLVHRTRQNLQLRNFRRLVLSCMKTRFGGNFGQIFKSSFWIWSMNPEFVHRKSAQCHGRSLEIRSESRSRSKHLISSGP